MEKTETRQHQFMEIQVTPVTIMEDEEGNPIPIGIPGKGSQTNIGCFKCNMGLEEAYRVECPGQDLFHE